MGDKNMKSNRKFIALIMAIVMIVNFSIFSAIKVFAHDAMLNVDYDDCTGINGSDGIDETWYALDVPPFCYHLGDEVNTIKYYFKESSSDGTYTWTTDISESVAQEIKNAYANSMKKWNNVYFYSYNDYGVLTKHKIINVVEGTASDHNLSIYPGTNLRTLASTDVVGSYELIESDPLSHRHYNEWEMNVYVNHFYVNSSNTTAEVNVVRERTGAHELGHILGIFDVDNLCNATITDWHHHELLMGYGLPLENRAFNITYKDIAGVAITRGFHTDNDHKWLNCGTQSDGKYKLVCSICNGVKEVSSLSGYTYKTYGNCGNNHSLSSGNMMAVASYGTKDYYKCKYCRYVAPFSSIVNQSYTKSNFSDTLHTCSNNVPGLEYTFYEEHNSYTYTWISKTQHERTCVCGDSSNLPHVVKDNAFNGPGGNAVCIICKGLASVGAIYSYNVNELPHTENGSYILSNGIIVLVDEDVDAYMNGNLTFYYGEIE